MTRAVKTKSPAKPPSRIAMFSGLRWGGEYFEPPRISKAGLPLSSVIFHAFASVGVQASAPFEKSS